MFTWVHCRRAPENECDCTVVQTMTFIAGIRDENFHSIQFIEWENNHKTMAASWFYYLVLNSVYFFMLNNLKLLLECFVVFISVDSFYPYTQKEHTKLSSCTWNFELSFMLSWKSFVAVGNFLIHGNFGYIFLAQIVVTSHYYLQHMNSHESSLWIIEESFEKVSTSFLWRKERK